MSDKNKIQGYYNPETNQNEYKPIIEDYTPVDYGTAGKTTPQKNQSTTIYIVIIVILALLTFVLCISIGRAEEKYNKLAHYAAQLEEQIDYAEKMSAIVSKTEKIEETNQTTVAPVETSESTTITEPAPTFKYDVKYISHKVDYDRNGNPVLLVTYEFTNNSDENASWTLKVHDKVFQNGVECGGVVFHDDINSQMQLNEIQPGTTVTIVDGYPLYDNTSTVTIECSELFGDEPMLVVDIELV